TLKIEHDRGPFNGLAEIVGTVADPSGAVVAGASLEAHELSSGGIRRAITNADGQFSLSGLPAGAYKVRIAMAGFRSALQTLTLQPRDRAVLSAVLNLGAVTQAVQVTAAPPPPSAPMAMAMEDRFVAKDRRAEGGVVGGVPGGVPGGQMGGVIGGVLSAVGPRNEPGKASGVGG